MKNEGKKVVNIGDRVTYFYIKNIKKWMFCPACKNGKMSFNKKNSHWVCEDCGYSFSEKYFLDDCVFWFCDECEAYLNNQEGFDKNAEKHICRKCGYENDTTFDNIKGICSDCGKSLPNPDATLCVECRIARREKRKERLGVVAAGAAVVAGTIVISAIGGDGDYEDTDDDDDYLLDGADSDLRRKYDSNWLQNASLEELQTGRERVHTDYSNPELDTDYRGDLWDLLLEFDTAIGEKRWEGKEPKGPAVHREHGWYLPNDD